MKRARFFMQALLILLFFETASFAGQQASVQGFQSLPFGSSYNAVVNYLNDKGLVSIPLLQDGEHAVSIHVNDYELGELEVTLTFYFDHNEKFYSFEFMTRKYTADYLKAIVFENGNTLNNIFKNKYGNPAKCYAPSILNIATGYISYLCKWDKQQVSIYTGYGTFESEYYAVGHVESKALSESFKIHKDSKNKALIKDSKDRF